MFFLFKTKKTCYTRKGKVGDRMYTGANFERALCVFKALSDPLRLELLRTIQKKDRVCVCELTEKFAMQQSKLSYHLKMLLIAELIDVLPDGKWNFYSLRRDTVREFLSEKMIAKLFST